VTEAEQKLFLLPNENLVQAIDRCVSVLQTPLFLEGLGEVAPLLSGDEKEPFLFALHSLSKVADQDSIDVADVSLLAGQVLQIFQTQTITGCDEDTQGFLEDMEGLIMTLLVASNQLVENCGLNDSADVLT